MASHKIKIEGVSDFTAISKDVEAISKQISKAFGDRGTKVLDEGSINFLKTAAPTLIGKVQEELKKLTDEAEHLDKALKAPIKDQKKQEELTKKRLDNVRKTVAAEKDLRALMKAQNIVNHGGQVPEAPKAEKPNVGGDLPDNVVPLKRKGGGESKDKSFGSVATKQISHSVQDVAGELPGVAPVMEVGNAAISAGKGAAAAGLGAPAIAALATLAAAAAAAAVVISRMVSGFEVFKQAMPNLIALTGMETKPITDQKTVGEAGKLGFGQLEVLDIQKQMEQALGKAKTPDEDQNRLVNVLTAARDTGMDPRQIVQGADQLRQQGGTEVASRQIASVLDKAVTSGMDKSQASSFLSASVSLLSEMNKSGIGNNERLLATMADLVAGGNMSSEMAGKTLSSMSNAISESSGENNSFFQGAAANAGLGSGSILGTQFAVRQGLAGINYGDAEKQVGDTEHGRMGIKAMKGMGLGDKDFSRKFADGILKEIDQRFDTKSQAGSEAALGFTGQMFGVKTAGEATKVLAVLEKLRQGTSLSKDDKKLLQDLGKDPDAAWREHTIAKLDQTAIATMATAAALEKGQFDLGKTSAEYINKLTGGLILLDSTISKMLNSETFTKLKEGLGKVVDVISNVMSGAFKDIMNLPSALSKVVDDIMADPLEFGKTMGKGFADIVMQVWTAMLKGIDSVWTVIMSVLKDPTKIVTAGQQLADDFKDTLKGAFMTLQDVGNGIMQGAAEGQEEFNQKGSVSYTPEQTKTLGDVGDAAKSIATPTGIGMAVRTGSEIYSAAKGNGVQATTPPSAAGTSPTAPAPTTDVSPVVDELKKTNMLLERSTRPGGAPRAGRETSRP